MMLMRTLLTLLMVLTSGCAVFRAKPVPVDHPVHELSSGVVWRDIIPGEGPRARTGDGLVVHYSARLAEGRPIDSSYDRGEPVSFVLGEAPVPGWNDALGGMQAGGRREATLPPEAAYGADGKGDWIPPNATLVFEFEVVEVSKP